MCGTVLPFIKMEGCGNDYVYIDCFSRDITNPSELSIKLSNRHFGIGGDGLVLICPSDIADAKMRMFNADGSEGKMCGNAVRCIAKYLNDAGTVNHNPITIETLSGVCEVSVSRISLKESLATVNMGKPVFNKSLIPAVIQEEKPIGICEKIGGSWYRMTCLSMGNPHCVVFCKDNHLNLDRLNIEAVGRSFETAPIFPGGINTEFVDIIGENKLRMRVWERGSGETLSCGSGACAAAVAAVENNYCRKGDNIEICLTGGRLTVKYTDDAVFLTGSAVTVFEGTVRL